MSTSTHPPITPGQRVETTSQNNDITGDWTPEATAEKKWNVTGTVINHSDSHGLCYEVRHDDGTSAWYDPTEFELLGNPVANAYKALYEKAEKENQKLRRERNTIRNITDQLVGGLDALQESLAEAKAIVKNPTG